MAEETGSYWGDIFSPENTSIYPIPLGEQGVQTITVLPSYTVNESYLPNQPIGGSGSIFDTIYNTGTGIGIFPSASTSSGYSRSDLGFGPGPNVTLGGSGLELPQKGGTGSSYATPLPSSGNEQWTNIYNQELARLNEVAKNQGKPAVSLADKLPGSDQTIGEYLIQKADSGFQWETDAEASKQAAAARNSAIGSTSQKLGIPIIIPLPVSPAMGAILTAAGLIASGGNVATLDPTKPIQSATGAVQGTVNTIGNIPSQISQGIQSIFSGPTAAGAPEAGAGLQQVTPIVVGAGALGGQSSSGANSTVTPGSLGGTPSGADTATGGTTQTGGEGGSPTIIGGGTTTGTQTGMDASQLQNVMGTILGGVTSAQQAQQAAEQQKIADIQSLGTTPTSTSQTQTGMDASQLRDVMGTILGGVTSAQQAQQAAEQQKTTDIKNLGATGSGTISGGSSTGADASTGGGISTGVTGTGGSGTGGGDTRNSGGSSTGVTGGGGGTGTGGGSGGGGGGGDTGGGGNTPGTTGTGGGGGGGGSGGTGGAGGTYTFIFSGNNSSYTPMATTPAQRDLQTELSKSVPALQRYQPSIMDMYGGIYQNLLGQTAIPQAAQQSLAQMQADAAKLQRIQGGQLAAEDIRNAQQAAREAYAARGQVMGQGAIGAEILNREAIRQQRENEARQAYQASMGNVFNAANLQTGNIFSPIGSLVSGTFNPLAAYEADVYGTNVNAINAAQIAEANRQAALESAKMGQTGTYAQALGTFLGSPTGSSFLKSLFG